MRRAGHSGNTDLGRQRRPQANPFVMTNVDGTPDAFAGQSRPEQLALLPLSRLRARHSLAQHDLGEVPMRPSIVVSRGAAAPRRERGVVLFVALIVLIIMTLAGLALLRQMTTGVSIAGNIAFKENATSVADRGAEVALQYLALPTTVQRAGFGSRRLFLELDRRPHQSGRPDQPDLVRLDPVADCWCRPTRRRPAIPRESSSIACACSPTRGSTRPARAARRPGPELGRVDRRRRLRSRRRSSAGDADALLSHHDPGRGPAQHGQLHAGSPAVTAPRAEKEKP